MAIKVTVKVFEQRDRNDLITEMSFSSLEEATAWINKLGTGSWEYSIVFDAI